VREDVALNSGFSEEYKEDEEVLTQSRKEAKKRRQKRN
jgi:hypothetical protein